jgi:guanylate kinase
MSENIDYSNKSEKIIIVGAAASGKDFVINYCVSKGLKRGMKWTTRPPRKGEVDGVDYFFIDEFKFKRMIEGAQFHEWESFDVVENGQSATWYYGSTWQDFDDGQVFIKTPSAITKLTREQREQCFIVYLDIPLEVRRNRLIERLNNLNDSDSYERRLSGDIRDFDRFMDYDLRIKDPDFDADMILGFMN